MTRRCSLCSSHGHSKRTCTTRRFAASGDGGVRLFGVRLTDSSSSIKKSASLGNLLHYNNASAAAGTSSTAPAADLPEGYHSDDPSHGSAATARRQAHRKKGTPWTEEEHRQFLVGLQKLGKGDWRGISKNYIPSKTPTQVASHAQKYFIRQSDTNRKKRRSSLFDMVPDTETNSSSSPERFSIPPLAAINDNGKLMFSSPQKSDGINPQPSLDLSLKPVFMPLPFQLWPPTSSPPKDDVTGTSLYHSVRPLPDVPKEAARELVGIAKLTLHDAKTVVVEPPPLSLRLPGE